MFRLLTGLLAAAAIAVPAATARMPVEPGVPCPTPGALVVYYVTEGVAYKDNLAIAPDGRASLCWARARPGAATGRTTFSVAPPTLKVLQTALDGVDVDHLGPAPESWPPCCFRRSTFVLYKGLGVPLDGQPRTPAAVQSLHRAQAILQGIVDRHAPEL